MTTFLIVFLGGWVLGNLSAYFLAMRDVRRKLGRIVERSAPTWEPTWGPPDMAQAINRLTRKNRDKAVTLPAITVIEAEFEDDRR